MTYCLAVKVNEGIVFASDSRTNAGVDYVRTVSKMYSFAWEGDRVITMLSSGNLATTQAVVNTIQKDLEKKSVKRSLLKMDHLFEIAEYVGDLSQKQQSRYEAKVKKSGGSAAAYFIVGGQIGDQEHDIFLVYPEGNYISASFETPYLQIGETKYGKPILDRIIAPNTSLDDVARCSIVSLDSTMRSNISVGPPIELELYRANSLEKATHLTYKLASPFYRSMQKSWNEGLQSAFENLPRFDWETGTED